MRCEVAGMIFRNPILLAAGTAAYGREVAGITALNSVGGIVTKAVSVELREGAPAPRVAEFDGGMINAIGLANPGVDAVVAEELPWLAAHAPTTRVIMNVVGRTASEFREVVERAEAAAVSGYELNVSCPNVKAGGMEFGADRNVLRELVGGVRAATQRPIFVKLSPTIADIGAAAATCADAGADGISVINTIPGMVVDLDSRRPALGFGSGGVSGAGLLPVGVLAVAKVKRAVALPVLGVGGVTRGTDAVQYLLAGASLVAVGTAALRDPRAPARIVGEIEEWCRQQGVAAVRDIVGKLEWA